MKKYPMPQLKEEYDKYVTKVSPLLQPGDRILSWKEWKERYGTPSKDPNKDMVSHATVT